VPRSRARAGGLGAVGIAVDGKTVRGAKGDDGKAPHLVAALAHGIGAANRHHARDPRRTLTLLQSA
jgi:hypothetical protein